MINKFKLGELILVKDGSVYNLKLIDEKLDEGGVLETKVNNDPCANQAPNIIHAFMDLGVQVERMLINKGTKALNHINMEA